MSLSDVSSLTRGDVLLVRFPFTDLTSSKVRPAVLLTDTTAISGKDGHFVFISTHEPVDQAIVAIEVNKGSPDWYEMQLKDTSYILPAKLCALEVSLVARKLGRAPPGLLQRIGAEISRALALRLT